MLACIQLLVIVLVSLGLLVISIGLLVDLVAELKFLTLSTRLMLSYVTD